MKDRNARAAAWIGLAAGAYLLGSGLGTGLSFDKFVDSDRLAVYEQYPKFRYEDSLSNLRTGVVALGFSYIILALTPKRSE